MQLARVQAHDAALLQALGRQALGFLVEHVAQVVPVRVREVAIGSRRTPQTKVLSTIVNDG